MNHEEWSADQKTRTVAVDDHTLEVAYRDDGDGEPVVFLHGIPTWGFLWRHVAPAVAGTGEYRAVVPDMVGYGNSDMRDSFDRSIRAQEAMLADLVEGLDLGSVSLVGHDIGGGVALRYAWHHPSRVDRLVLSNATCYDSWPVEFIADLGLPTSARMARDEFEGNLDFAFAEGTYDEADPAFVAGMKAPWLSEAGQVSLCRCAVATNTNHTTEIDYGAVAAETLCLWGADDAMQPVEYGERLAADLDGEVVRLDGAYHWVVEDRPEAYRDELLAFLAA